MASVGLPFWGWEQEVGGTGMLGKEGTRRPSTACRSCRPSQHAHTAGPTEDLAAVAAALGAEAVADTQVGLSANLLLSLKFRQSICVVSALLCEVDDESQDLLHMSSVWQSVQSVLILFVLAIQPHWCSCDGHSQRSSKSSIASVTVRDKI